VPIPNLVHKDFWESSAAPEELLFLYVSCKILRNTATCIGEIESKVVKNT
jgi:hypothetical protein